METPEVLAIVRQLLAPRQLTYLEEVILTQTLEGKLYREIALDVGYELSYVRDVGSKLWTALSQVVGVSVTKKNVLAILNRYHGQQSALPGSTESSQTFVSMRGGSGPGSKVTNAVQFPGRALEPMSAKYIERPPIETLVYRSLLEAGSLTRIQAPRQMGKTSLVHHVFHQLQRDQRSMTLVYLNFRQVDQSTLSDLDRFLRWFCWTLSQKVGLEPQLNQYWMSEVGAKVNCSNYLQNRILAQRQQPLVIAFDDLSRLLNYPEIAQDVLPMFRTWHEEAIVDSSWEKLRLLLLHNAEVNVPLPLSQSPFNVGVDIRLPDLTPVQVQTLAERCGVLQIENAPALDALYELLGGHPYLLQMAFHWLVVREMPIDDLIGQATSLSGIFRQHLRYYWMVLQENPVARKAFEQVLLDTSGAGVELNVQAACWLEELGLIKLVGDRAQVARPLYQDFFSAQRTQNIVEQLDTAPNEDTTFSLRRAMGDDF